MSRAIASALWNFQEFRTRAKNPLLHGATPVGRYRRSGVFFLCHCLGWCVALAVAGATILCMRAQLQYRVFSMGIDGSVLMFYFSLPAFLLLSIGTFNSSDTFYTQRHNLAQLSVTRVSSGSIVFGVVYGKVWKYVAFVSPLFIVQAGFASSEYSAHDLYGIPLPCLIIASVEAGAISLATGVTALCHKRGGGVPDFSFNLAYSSANVIFVLVVMLISGAIFDEPLYYSAPQFLQATSLGIGVGVALCGFWIVVALCALDDARIRLGLRESV